MPLWAISYPLAPAPASLTPFHRRPQPGATRQRRPSALERASTVYGVATGTQARNVCGERDDDR
jgi:hypothetical protein